MRFLSFFGAVFAHKKIAGLREVFRFSQKKLRVCGFWHQCDVFCGFRFDQVQLRFFVIFRAVFRMPQSPPLYMYLLKTLVKPNLETSGFLYVGFNETVETVDPARVHVYESK